MSKRKRPLRYDLPQAAPQPLRLVQLFVNTTDLERTRELLATPADVRAWFAEHGLETGPLGAAALVRVHELRLAVRGLVAGEQPDAALADAARRARLTVELAPPRLVSQAGGLDGALGRIVATIYDARRDGSWSRLKPCRNCGWAYWDASRNRSAAWCSMQLCGNRAKVRRYRSRRRGAATEA